MYGFNLEKCLLKLGIATLLSLEPLLQPAEPVKLARLNGLAMVTGRILNVPDHIARQPVPMTENMAASETNYYSAA